MAAPAAAASPAPVVLVVGKVMERVEQGISRVALVRRLPEADPERAAFLAQEGSRVVAAVTTSFEGFPNALYPHLPSLKLISNFGVGYDAIDAKKAQSLDIEITNTPDVLTDDVADIALGLMLCIARRLCFSDRYVRAGRWPNEGMTPLTSKFTGKTVGILGLGRIGQAIAKRAEAFDCKIEYFSRSPKAGVAYKYHSTPESLASASDYLVVACALTDETKGIVSRVVLQALGPKGTLINIGRGGHVDEPALVKALVEGIIGGAGLDVFADEPNVPEELLSMDNVVLLPHVGSNSIETRSAMADVVVSNVLAFLEGKPLVTPVPKEILIEGHHVPMSLLKCSMA